MADENMVSGLRYLYRIVEAGERGYAVSAVNMNNQGLKILFRAHAQQRLKFKNEILSEIRSLGRDAQLRGSFRGVLHRGRINIFAALTIGNEEREMVVLKEILVGERVTLRAYETVLKKNLSPAVREIVARQRDEVRRVVEQVHLMKGKQGKRLVVHLFETRKDAEDAVQELKNAGWDLELIERATFGDTIEIYKGRGTTVLETILSGAAGGGLFGSLIGALAGIGAQQPASLVVLGTAPPYDIWSLVALGGIAIGAFIGGFLGFAIGIGISEEDTFLYKSTKYGHLILMILLDTTRASEAKRIMSRLSLQSMVQIEKSPA